MKPYAVRDENGTILNRFSTKIGARVSARNRAKSSGRIHFVFWCNDAGIPKMQLASFG